MPDAHLLSGLKQDIASLCSDRLRERIITACSGEGCQEIIDALEILSEEDFSHKWGYLRRTLFEALRISHLACIDAKPIDILTSAYRTDARCFFNYVEEVALKNLRKQVEIGNTFLIDVEELVETQAAILIPQIASTRIEHLRSVCEENFDSQRFVQSYYGFKLTTSEVRNNGFGEKLIDHLNRLGIVLPSDTCPVDFDFEIESVKFDNVSDRMEKILCEILRLTGNNSGERAKAAQSLGIIGDSRAEPYLCAATEDKYPWVKKAVIEALGSIRLSSSIPVLVECLYDLESSVREKAANTIAKFEEKAIPHLLNVLKNDREVHFENALEEAKKSHPRSLDSFAAALLHRDSEAKQLARKLLNDLGHAVTKSPKSGGK